MKTVDKVFEVLKVEGLVPEKESYGIGFKYPQLSKCLGSS